MATRIAIALIDNQSISGARCLILGHKQRRSRRPTHQEFNRQAAEYSRFVRDAIDLRQDQPRTERFVFVPALERWHAENAK